MRIIIELDEDYSTKSAKEYLNCIKIDDELINKITFERGVIDE